jgi:hypothetical protein
MMVEELYDALIEAGASEEKARAASRAVADMEKHFGDVEKDILSLRSHVDRGFADLRGILRLHNWMLGTILAFLVAVFFKVFSK